MESIQIVIVMAIALMLIAVGGYISFTLRANRQFKPIPVKEAEAMVEALITRRYGRRKNSKQRWYQDFVQEFPEYAAPNYNYDYLLQCLRPTTNRSNPDFIETVLRFFEKTFIVENSITHLKMIEKG
ncbi:hypothetical protein [Roseivirga seohaensis]|uniref:hypothetical protein n=1 Tax=Roseivirga seohaensis TaxID=1914963 RepID=UPI003BAB4382